MELLVLHVRNLSYVLFPSISNSVHAAGRKCTLNIGGQLPLQLIQTTHRVLQFKGPENVTQQTTV